MCFEKFLSAGSTSIARECTTWTRCTTWKSLVSRNFQSEIHLKGICRHHHSTKGQSLYFLTRSIFTTCTSSYFLLVLYPLPKNMSLGEPPAFYRSQDVSAMISTIGFCTWQPPAALRRWYSTFCTFATTGDLPATLFCTFDPALLFSHLSHQHNWQNQPKIHELGKGSKNMLVLPLHVHMPSKNLHFSLFFLSYVAQKTWKLRRMVA